MSCLNDVMVEYTPKDKNHIYTMSTAMYELYKTEILNFYENRSATDEHNLKIKISNAFDKTNACVETQINFHKRHKGAVVELHLPLICIIQTAESWQTGKTQTFS